MSAKNHTLRVTLGQHSRAGQGGVNQDFHGAVLPAEPLRSTKGIAVALADGIGSSAVSQEASAAAVRSFLDDYYATSDAWSVRRSAQRVLGATNAWLHAQTMRSHARFDKDRGYVCTFSALILKGRDIHLLHVGDSRIYRVHAQSLEPLTQDHRVHLSSVESFLGRALGTGPNVEIDYTSLPADVGAIYLLATDGAYLHIDAAAVHEALALYPDDWDHAAQALVDTAQARGADDDMTVQLLRVDALPEVPLRDLQTLRADLATAPLLVPNALFEGYRIVRELHASARSHVYLAVDGETGQQVVIKTPSTDMASDAQYLDRFLLEEWVARRIQSPHVLRPHVHERRRRHMYVAMEFVEGHTLGQWMIDHPHPDLDTVRGLIAQVGKGLHAFHVKEMLHQDLRPDNVMIDRQGTLRIIDFGSTHVAGLQEGRQDQRADFIAGTLQYTAPEYFVGHEGSAQSDLFSLAVLAYQMLTAQLPYGLHAARVRSVADIKALRYVPVRHFRPDLPAWLDGVLQKALSADPARRQEAVSEFLFDLHSPGRPFHDRPSVPLVQRNPVVFWQAVSLLLGLVVVALIAARVFGW
ncbi:protein kinase domain-containing protein [Acidovorax sp. LjRoot117]|uniref:protein kinase domain-containing protein n=1 Tax=Acidovorax sp. LjRoot117 TaxID=3342255 RepID=UPI003ECFE66D